MKKIKDILKLRVITFPDDSCFTVQDLIIGGLILYVFILIN